MRLGARPCVPVVISVRNLLHIVRRMHICLILMYARLVPSKVLNAVVLVVPLRLVLPLMSMVLPLLYLSRIGANAPV